MTRSRAIAAGAAVVALPRLVGAQTLAKIRFSGVPTDDLTPIFWAIKTGAFAKAGIDVEFVPTGSGTASTTAVIAGTYEMGKGSQIASFIAYLKGIPIVVVANGAIWEINNAWAMGVVAADAPYKTAADLNGQTIGAAGLNDLATLGINAWVDKNGGDSKTLKWVEIPGSALAPALVEHRIAAGQLNEPQLRAALDSGKVRTFAPFLSGIANSFVSTVYFARPDWAKANRALVERFVAVAYEAAAYTNTHPGETAQLIADTTKIPLAVVTKMVRSRSATNSNPDAIQSSIDVAAKYGQIPRAFPAKEIFL